MEGEGASSLALLGRRESQLSRSEETRPTDGTTDANSTWCPACAPIARQKRVHFPEEVVSDVLLIFPEEEMEETGSFIPEEESRGSTEKRKFEPDWISGILCPVQSMLLHSFGNREEWWLAFPALVLFVVMFVFSISLILLQVGMSSTFWSRHEEDLQKGSLTEITFLKGELDSDLQIISSLDRTGKLVLHFIGILVFFFIFRRKMAPKSSGDGPSLLSRILCPFATVYYYEHNKCNEKGIFALCCGCFYTAFFYKPSVTKPDVLPEEDTKLVTTI